MTERIRIGVAGAGVFGGYHCGKIADLTRAELVGVYDIDRQRAKALADRFGARAIEEFPALLDEADAIVIAAPAFAHYALAHEALTAGKHVFLEKPIALNVAEASRLIDLAGANGVVLQVGHQERYVAEAAGLLDRPASPVKIECRRQTSASGRCEDVSVVLDLMIHDLDLVRKLTGAEIETVAASGDAHAAQAELHLNNGAVVSLTASRRASAPERRMTLIYDDGVIEFDFVNRKAANTTPTPLRSDFDGDALPLAFRDPLAFGANAFVAAIDSRTAPQVTGEDGRRALEWALAIENAAGINAETEFAPREQRRRA